MHPRAWVPFLVMMFILGALANSGLLVTLSVTTAAILGLSAWWRTHALDGIRYTRQLHFRRGFPEEEIPLQIRIENNKALPLTWLKAEDPWPQAVGPNDLAILAPSHILTEGYLTHALSLRWFARVRRSYMLQLRRRGYFSLGPARITTGDLLGMYEVTGEIGARDTITVFPRILPRSALRLPAEDPFGSRKAPKRIYEDPSQQRGVREYQPQDEFRRIHWPATARTGRLQVKEYEPVTARELVVGLNVTTFPHYWEGVYPALLEHLVSMAASIGYYGFQDGYSIGLISNGCLASADRPYRLSPGRRPQQLTMFLEALAQVTSFTNASFDRYLIQTAPQIPYGATLVLVTAVITPPLVEALITLKKYRPRMTLISVEQAIPPAITGLQVIHLPFKEAD